MKAMTVTLTDEEADELEARARAQGVSANDLLHDAVLAYVDSISNESAHQGSLLGIIGIGASGYTDTASRMDEILAEEWTRHLLVDEVSYPDPTTSDLNTAEDHQSDHDRFGESA